MRFSYRQYQDGDASAINDLYFQVTGRRRTVEQHAWQWLSSPAGDSEMWLIECELSDGSRKLIGHHGVMPELFTFRGKQVRVGKTENTMVLPEYRDKILYPRFEKKFLENYEGKFHALFSTMGPAPAIRLRKALGYVAPYRWINMYFGKEPFISLHLAMSRLSTSSHNLSKLLVASASVAIDTARIFVLKGNGQDFDFDSYWSTVSPQYGLTPARTRNNMNWRFWTNPYHQYVTLKIVCPSHGTGIGVLSTRGSKIVCLDDVFCQNPEQIQIFIEIICRWVKKVAGNKTIVFVTTSDFVCRPEAVHAKTNTWLQHATRNQQKVSSCLMPRKITALGRYIGLAEAASWYITPFVFEGR